LYVGSRCHDGGAALRLADSRLGDRWGKNDAVTIDFAIVTASTEFAAESAA
jgi:hypothetical protein